MMNKITIFFAIIISLLLWGCLDEIELEVGEGDAHFVVSGNIHSGEPPYTIQFAKSAQVSTLSQGFSERLTGAIIKILDDAGNDEILTETEAGVYQTAPDGIRGTVGRTYFLEIEYDGKTFLSNPEKLRPVSSAQSLETEFKIEQDFNDQGNLINVEKVTLFVNTPFATDEDIAYMKWNVSGIYEYPELMTAAHFNPKTCYVSENIDFDNVVVQSSEGLSDNFLQKEELLSRNVNYKFYLGYCFTVVQQSLTKEAYEFWEIVGAEFERSGDIFETPPSKIRGNLYNPDNTDELILGYFSASAVDTSRILVLGTDVGNPRPQCTHWPAPPATCFNCLMLPRSTHDLPVCWQ